MHKIGFVLYPGFSAISFSIASVFELANWKVGKKEYEVELVSEHGGLVQTSLGYQIQTTSFKRKRYDTIIVAGDVLVPEVSPGLLRYMKSVQASSARIASTCTGAFVLAAAGILDGRRATTHWYYAKKLQDDYPEVDVQPDRIFTKDGRVWTSAGMSSGTDLALALVEDDLGDEVAHIVAKLLVVYHRRAGGQSQHSALLELGGNSDRVQSVLDFVRENLSERLSVEDLAATVFLSPRQFSRLFQEETGHSPAKAVERLRVEAARLMMEEGRFSADDIALKNGFGNRERMRRAFLRAIGKSPQAIRSEVQASDLPRKRKVMA